MIIVFLGLTVLPAPPCRRHSSLHPDGLPVLRSTVCPEGGAADSKNISETSSDDLRFKKHKQIQQRTHEGVHILVLLSLHFLFLPPCRNSEGILGEGQRSTSFKETFQHFINPLVLCQSHVCQSHVFQSHLCPVQAVGQANARTVQNSHWKSAVISPHR